MGFPSICTAVCITGPWAVTDEAAEGTEVRGGKRVVSALAAGAVGCKVVGGKAVGGGEAVGISAAGDTACEASVLAIRKG